MAADECGVCLEPADPLGLPLQGHGCSMRFHGECLRANMRCQCGRVWLARHERWVQLCEDTGQCMLCGRTCDRAPTHPNCLFRFHPHCLPHELECTCGLVFKSVYWAWLAPVVVTSPQRVSSHRLLSLAMQAAQKVMRRRRRGWWGRGVRHLLWGDDTPAGACRRVEIDFLDEARKRATARLVWATGESEETVVRLDHVTTMLDLTAAEAAVLGHIKEQPLH